MDRRGWPEEGMWPQGRRVRTLRHARLELDPNHHRAPGEET
jgi:hypothetical protein